MIITETIYLREKEFIHNYSDSGFLIKKTGTEEIYDDAFDIPENNFTYEETEIRRENDNIDDSNELEGEQADESAVFGDSTGE